MQVLFSILSHFFKCFSIISPFSGFIINSWFPKNTTLFKSFLNMEFSPKLVNGLSNIILFIIEKFKFWESGIGCSFAPKIIFQIVSQYLNICPIIKSGFQNLVEDITELKWNINPGIAIGHISFFKIFKASVISILFSGSISIIL